MTGRLTDFREELLGWSATTRRDLPWRRTRDPWAVLVSEVMLQQTQVARVAPRFTRFLMRYPAPANFADATPGEAVRSWEGLGYYRRALQLHATARRLVSCHGGEVPDGLEELLALPGVGPYTARAVLVFAFERHHAVLDTNVARVVSRAVAGRRLGRAEGQALAEELVPPGRAWEWNQAVLDLGATVCSKRAPSCDGCPVRRSCRWRAAGHAPPDPAEGSAGTSRPQAPFEGSDRQGRGRLVAALRSGAVPWDRVAEAAGWPAEPGRAERVALGLVADGLAERVDGELRFPGS